MTHHALTLRVYYHKRGNGKFVKIDEPDLLYLACKLKGHPFRQFVKGELVETRAFWQDAIEGLEAIVTSLDVPATKTEPKVKKYPERVKQGAFRLLNRIADVLVREPPVEIEEPEPDVPAVEAGKQLVLF